ncbi:MAG: beta-propeller fold lactonase family protein [Actinomycetales bacterium]|nr:beta-propeller fold lactonase family protein [Actinomycetales bacterium]
MTALLVGGYGADGGGSAPGIGWAEIEPSGALTYRGVLAEVASPSWLTRRGDLLLAALEPSARLAGFRIERAPGAPRLAPLGEPVPTSAAACSIAVAGDEALVAGYVDGVVAVHPLGENGPEPAVQRIAGEGSGPLPAQASPHAHAALVLASGEVLTADLGADRVYRLVWGSSGWERRGEIALPPGTGPRDLLALPDGRVAVLGEWGRTVHLLEPTPGADAGRAGGADGPGWRVGPGAVVPGGEDGGQAAGLVASPDGRTLYAAVRGPDVIGALALDDDGLRKLAATPCGGSWPRHLLAHDGLLHASLQLADAVASFRLGADGGLEPVGAPTPVPSPTCLAPLG